MFQIGKVLKIEAERDDKSRSNRMADPPRVTLLDPVAGKIRVETPSVRFLKDAEDEVPRRKS